MSSKWDKDELVITHYNGKPSSPPPSHSFLLFKSKQQFEVYSKTKFPKSKKTWSTKKIGKTGHLHTIKVPKGSFQVQVSGGAIDEGHNTFKVVFRKRNHQKWQDLPPIPMGPQSANMELIRDIDGDGFPEFLRSEAMVGCEGGSWADVVKIYPRFKVLASHKVAARGCN